MRSALDTRRVHIPARLWHNHGTLNPDRRNKPRPALDRDGLERLALHYAGRYATTRAKLRAYLLRKVGERGWSEETEPPVERMVERFAELGYVDDAAFAASRTASLQRRGYGERRIGQALKHAGIDEEDGREARRLSQEGAWEAALRFAERKRIGPFAAEPLDRPARERAFAAMVRAGHEIKHVRRVLDAAPGEIPNPDNM
jgi:regulatory protein